MSPRPNSTKLRRVVFDRHKHIIDGRPMLCCHVCTRWLDPVRDEWHADHAIARSIDGSDSVENVKPICIDCHGEKTKTDTTIAAKVKRVSDKHYGVKQRGAWGAGRNTGWKRRMNGSVERR